MDEPSQPTAAELGITEEEYERILRDLRERRGGGLVDGDGPPPAPSARHARRVRQLPVRVERWLRRVQLVAVATAVGAALLLVLARVVVGGPYAPTYEFMRAEGDQPVTYTSCRPIQVAIYPAGGPPHSEQLVREAVAEVRSATGLDIVVVGVFGGYAANWNFEAGPVLPDDPISVSWQDGDAIAQITDEVAGLGGSRLVSNRDGSQRWVAGTIALSRDYYATLDLEDPRDHVEALAVLLHEFGHVFGLAHVESPHELMATDGGPRDTYGKGDLEGLRRLGHGPCV